MNKDNAFIYNKGKLGGNESWVYKPVYGGELMGMRLLRRKTREEMAKAIGLTLNEIIHMEETDAIVYPGLTSAYMKYLNCNYNHVIQFRRIIDGHLDEFQESRHVNSNLKNEVYNKYNNKCSHCGSENDLHIHHIKSYSEGGLSEIDNLKLLCVDCHAEEHKEEPAYHMLKAMAKG